MLHATKKAFTLIELLVVITIIGILATGAVSVYTSQIQKARDTTRIADITALQRGVEQYYQDTSEYPQGGDDWISGASTDVQDYVPSLAQDPKDTQNCNTSLCGYAYEVGADTVGILQGSYELSTAFENDGNRTNKATGDIIGSNTDDNRWELAIGGGDFDTSKAQSTTWGSVITGADSTAKIHIRKNEITAF